MFGESSRPSLGRDVWPSPWPAPIAASFWGLEVTLLRAGLALKQPGSWTHPSPHQGLTSSTLTPG